MTVCVKKREFYIYLNKDTGLMFQTFPFNKFRRSLELFVMFHYSMTVLKLLINKIHKLRIMSVCANKDSKPKQTRHTHIKPIYETEEKEKTK